MLMKFLYALLFSSFIISDSYNMQLLSYMPFEQECSDITGFYQDGREFAVIGLQNAAAFVDITDPHNPKLTGQVWMGGLLGKAPIINGVKIAGGPQMYQLSLDGKRMYVTTSLFSTWDNQFYPEIRKQGGAMIMIDCDVENGGMKINKDFIVDFGKEPNGPSRCHESRYPGGDCTSDIWL